MSRLPDSYTRHPRTILWLVREGECTIGDDDNDRAPAFRVHVGSFYLGKRPITNRQYEAFAPGHPRADPSAGDDDPVSGVNFYEAASYCRWYADVSRKPIRLPTEVEWEYACRAGSAARYFFGDDPAQGDRYLIDAANGNGRTAGLDVLKPNRFGLQGMLGGVWEWTASLHLPYPARDGDERNDLDADGPRVLRGGSYRVARGDLGSAVRRGADPTTRADDIGFRIARTF